MPEESQESVSTASCLKLLAIYSQLQREAIYIVNI
jgi:hypothetical protein